VYISSESRKAWIRAGATVPYGISMYFGCARDDGVRNKCLPGGLWEKQGVPKCYGMSRNDREKVCLRLI